MTIMPNGASKKKRQIITSFTKGKKAPGDMETPVDEDLYEKRKMRYSKTPSEEVQKTPVTPDRMESILIHPEFYLGEGEPTMLLGDAVSDTRMDPEQRKAFRADQPRLYKGLRSIYKQGEDAWDELIDESDSVQDYLSQESSSEDDDGKKYRDRVRWYAQKEVPYYFPSISADSLDDFYGSMGFFPHNLGPLYNRADPDKPTEEELAREAQMEERYSAEVGDDRPFSLRQIEGRWLKPKLKDDSRLNAQYVRDKTAIHDVPSALTILNENGLLPSYVKEMGRFIPRAEGESDEAYQSRLVSNLLRMRDFQKGWENVGSLEYGDMINRIMDRMNGKLYTDTDDGVRVGQYDPDAKTLRKQNAYLEGPKQDVKYISQQEKLPPSMAGYNFDATGLPTDWEPAGSPKIINNAIPFTSIPAAIKNARTYAGNPYSDNYQRYMTAVLTKALLAKYNDSADPRIADYLKEEVGLDPDNEKDVSSFDAWFGRLEAPVLGEATNAKGTADLTSTVMRNVLSALDTADLYNKLDVLSREDKSVARDGVFPVGSPTRMLSDLLDKEYELYTGARDAAIGTDDELYFTPKDGTFDEYDRMVQDARQAVAGRDIDQEKLAPVADLINSAITGDYYIRGNRRLKQPGVATRSKRKGKLFKIPYALQKQVVQAHRTPTVPPSEEGYTQMRGFYDQVLDRINESSGAIIPTILHNRANYLRSVFADSPFGGAVADKLDAIAGKIVNDFRSTGHANISAEDVAFLKRAGADISKKGVLGTLLKDKDLANTAFDVLSKNGTLLTGDELAGMYTGHERRLRNEEGLLMKNAIGQLLSAFENQPKLSTDDWDENGYLSQYLASPPVPLSAVNNLTYRRPKDWYGQRSTTPDTDELRRKRKARRGTAKDWKWSWRDGYKDLLNKISRGGKITPDELQMLRNRHFIEDAEIMSGGAYGAEDIKKLLGENGWTGNPLLKPERLADRIGRNDLLSKMMDISDVARVMGDDATQARAKDLISRIAAQTAVDGGVIKNAKLSALQNDADGFLSELGVGMTKPRLQYSDDWLNLGQRLEDRLEGKRLAPRMSQALRFFSAIRDLRALPDIQSRIDELKDNLKAGGEYTEDDEGNGSFQAYTMPERKALAKELANLKNTSDKTRANLLRLYKGLITTEQRKENLDAPVKEKKRDYSVDDMAGIGPTSPLEVDESSEDAAVEGNEVDDAFEKYQKELATLDPSDIAVNILAELARRAGFSGMDSERSGDAPYDMDDTALLRVGLGMDPYYDLDPQVYNDKSEVIFGEGETYGGGADPERALDQKVGARRRLVSDDDLGRLLESFDTETDEAGPEEEKITQALNEMTGFGKTWPEWNKILHEVLIPAARQRHSDDSQEGTVPALANTWDGLSTAEEGPMSKEWARDVGYLSPEEADINEQALKADLRQAYDELVKEYGSYDGSLGLGIPFPQTFEEYLKIPRQIRTIYSTYLRNMQDEAIAAAQKAWEQGEHAPDETFDAKAKGKAAQKALREAPSFDEYMNSKLYDEDPIAGKILFKIWKDHASNVRKYRDMGPGYDRSTPKKKQVPRKDDTLTSSEAQMLADEWDQMNSEMPVQKPAMSQTYLSDTDKDLIRNFWHQMIANSRSGMPVAKFLQEAGAMLRDLPVSAQDALISKIRASPQDWSVFSEAPFGKQTLPIMSRLRKSEQQNVTEACLETFCRSIAELGHTPIIRVKKA